MGFIFTLVGLFILCGFIFKFIYLKFLFTFMGFIFTLWDYLYFVGLFLSLFI